MFVDNSGNVLDDDSQCSNSFLLFEMINPGTSLLSFYGMVTEKALRISYVSGAVFPSLCPN